MWIHPLWEVAESTFYLHWLDRVFAVKLASPMQNTGDFSGSEAITSFCDHPLLATVSNHLSKVGLPGFSISTGGSQMVANQSPGLCD